MLLRYPDSQASDHGLAGQFHECRLRVFVDDVGTRVSRDFRTTSRHRGDANVTGPHESGSVSNLDVVLRVVNSERNEAGHEVLSDHGGEPCAHLPAVSGHVAITHPQAQCRPWHPGTH